MQCIWCSHTEHPGQLHRSRTDVNNITSFENYSGEIGRFFSLRANEFPEKLKKQAWADTRK